jgi:TRAP-type C4-dicarboxylate transport system substrate-binding protein
MRPNPASAALTATLAALALGGCGGSGGDKAGGERDVKATVLTLANATGNEIELQPWADAVAKRSGGTLRITFKNFWRRGQADGEPNLIRDVKAGKTDLGWAAPRAFDDVGVTAFDALNAPLLVDSLPLERTVLQSPLAAQMLGALKPAGVTGLGILPGPLRRPLGVAPLVRPQDYEGETIALARSQVGARTLQALGARTASLPATGSIQGYDGVEQQIASIAGNRYDSIASHLTANVALWPRPLVLFANPQALDKLTDRQRDALTGAAKDAFAPTYAFQQKDEADAAAVLCRRGVTFETAGKPDLAALRRAVQPVYDRLDQQAPTKAAIAQIQAMRGDSGPAAAPSCSAASPSDQAAVDPTPVDGVYRTDVTLAEIRRAPGFGAGEDNPDNVGHLKLELRSGKFRISGATEGSEVDGTYALSGDDIAIEFNGEGPYHYRWSVYRGALTLRKRGGGPTGLAVHPWRRETAKPSVGARTPIDGVWEMNASREEVIEEMVRHGNVTKAMAKADLVSENWGHWRFSFNRGQLYYTQAAAGSRRWTRARYTVKGHTVTITVTEYGGEAPHGSAEKTGEQFGFRWSRYRDRLTMSPLMGAISPENFTADTWRKVG